MCFFLIQKWSNDLYFGVFIKLAFKILPKFQQELEIFEQLLIQNEKRITK